MKPRLNLLKWPVLVLAAAGFLWLKRYGLHFTVGGDENTYYYMARLMSTGKLFYRDYFYAHPPLNLLILTAIYRLFGLHLAALKLTASLPVLLAASALYLQFWKKGRGLSAIFFLLILLFNYELLKVTTHPFGVSLTAAFLMFSLYSFLEDHPLAGGIFWGLASVTGLYALPWGAVPVVYYLLNGSSRRMLPKFILGFLMIFGTVNIACLLLFGESYYTPVYLYHLLKPKSPEPVSDLYIQTIRRNLVIFFLPFLYAWIPRTGKRTAILAAALLYLIILGAINPLFSQYFMLPIPYLAWIGAVSLAGILPPRSACFRRGAALVVALLCLIGFNRDNIIRYLEREKIIGFATEKQCVDFIRENSCPDDLLFGHVTTAPLLSLLTGRELALDMVDTNHMRFQSGLADLAQVMERLRNEPRLKFVIIQENRFWTSPEVESHLARWSTAAVFSEPRGRIVIYDCRPEP